MPLFVLFAGLPALGFGQTSFDVAFAYQIGGTVPAPETYTISGPATPLTLTLNTDGAAWVAASLSRNYTPADLTITVNPGSLTVGNYTSTIEVDSAQGYVVFHVTLNVTGGPAGSLTLSPSAFTFNAIAGGTTPASQTLLVTAQTAASATAQMSKQSCAASNWLTLSPTGSFTATPTGTYFTVSVDPSGLAAGTTCTGTISIAAGAVTQSANVTLQVASPTAGALTLSSAALTFYAIPGGSAPASQILTVTAQTISSATAQVATQSCANSNWLTLSPTGSFTAGPTGTNFTVSVDPSGLSAGATCTGTITISANSTTQTATVTLTMISGTPGVLTANASSLTFGAVAGGAPPAPVTFTVTAQTPTSATAVVTQLVCTASNWLTLYPTGSFTAGPTGSSFTVSVNQSGMTAGTTCSGTIALTSSAGTLILPVTLTMFGAASSVLTLSPSALSFSAVAGGAAPASQTFSVTAGFDTSATAMVSQQSCGLSHWLTLSPAGSFTASPTNTYFTVSVDPSGMAADTTCTGTIYVIAATGARPIPVTLKVIAGKVEPFTLSPSALTFNAVAGQSAPLPQTLSVTAQTTLATTAQVSEQSCANLTWLTLSPSGSFTSSIGATNLTVSVDPSGLSSGTTCTGTISIISSLATQTVGVAMFVSASSDAVVTVSAAPTTLLFNYSVGDSSPVPQVVAISAAGAAGTFSVAASSSGWLRVSPTCASAAPCTTPNTGTLNLVVTADPTGLNIGTYYGVIVISGTGQTTGITNVNVSFTVTAPVPAISLVTNAASFVAGPVSPGEMISIFADAANPIGPATAVKLDGTTCPAPCTNIPTAMGGVQVIFQPGGIAAPLLYLSGTQIICVVPYEILSVGSLQVGSIQVQVSYLGQRSAAKTLQFASTQPGIFTALGTGTGLATVQQYDAEGTYQGQNSSSNPAKPGWPITFYVTGEGIVPSPAVTGKVNSGSSVVVPLLGPPSVLIDDLPATVTFFAEASDVVSGMMQVNAKVPDGVHTGQAVSLVLSMNGNNSQPGVVVYIK